MICKRCGEQEKGTTANIPGLCSRCIQEEMREKIEERKEENDGDKTDRTDS